MSVRNMHAAQAQKLSLVALGGAVAAGALAGVVLMPGVITIKPAEVAVVREGAAAPPEQTIEPIESFRVDFDSLISDLSQLDPKEDEPEAAPEDDSGTEVAQIPKVAEQPPAPQTGNGVEFLGSVITPRKRMALVRFEGDQKLLAEGQAVEADGPTLVTVDRDWIIMDDGGKQTRIVKLERKGALVGSASAKPGGMNPGSIAEVRSMSGERNRNEFVDPQTEQERRSIAAENARQLQIEEARRRALEARRAREDREALGEEQ